MFVFYLFMYSAGARRNRASLSIAHANLYIVHLMFDAASCGSCVCVFTALKEKVLSVRVCCVISDCSGYVNPIPHRNGKGRGQEETGGEVCVGGCTVIRSQH